MSHSSFHSICLPPSLSTHLKPLGKMEIADQKRSLKDIKPNLILNLQTRARWYRAIKAKRYKPTNRDESHGSAELTHVIAQNQELKNVVQALMQEFPQLTKNITKALNMLREQP